MAEDQLHKDFVQAVYKETAIREASFLDFPVYDICGLSVRQLTPYLYLLLDFADNPFVKDRLLSPTPEIAYKEIIDFLWTVSYDFELAATDKRIKFEEQLLGIPLTRVIEGIYEYLSAMFLDTLYKEKKENNYVASYYPWIAGYIDLIASEYCWDEQKILHLPIPRLLVYANTIYSRKQKELGKPVVLHNKLSDPILKKLREKEANGLPK